MRKYIDAFFLVLTVGLTGLPQSYTGVIPPLAIGSALMIMVYAGGHISGGYFNPAVTLGLASMGLKNLGPPVGLPRGELRRRRGGGRALQEPKSLQRP